MTRRTPRWFFVLAILSVLVLLRVEHDRQFETSRDSRLHQLREGRYRIVRLINETTLVVEPIVDGLPSRGSFPIRLASIEPNTPSTSTPLERNVLLTLLRSTEVEIRFDKHRFDVDSMPLAYVFDNDLLLNAELVAAGGARPSPIPGNSARLQRLIAQAAATERR